MIIYSQNMVVLPVPSPATIEELNRPLIGFNNLVTGGSLSADTEQNGFPVANLSTPVTYQRWRGTYSASIQFITFINPGTEEIDYLAVAGHNFSSGAFPLKVEAAYTYGSDAEPDWFDVTADQMLPDDGPVLFRFDKFAYLAVRLSIGVGDGSVDPFAAVMYIGKLLTLPRRIYVGHSPMSLNVQSDVLSGRGETGQFLGRVTRREFNNGAINLTNIDPAFMRTYIKPWFTSARTLPFFFAWRPYGYPYEVAFCWDTSNGTATNDRPNGLMKIGMSLQGLV